MFKKVFKVVLLSIIILLLANYSKKNCMIEITFKISFESNLTKAEMALKIGKVLALTIELILKNEKFDYKINFNFNPEYINLYKIFCNENNY